MRTPRKLEIELATERDNELFSALINAPMTVNANPCRGFAKNTMLLRACSIDPVGDKWIARVTLVPNPVFMFEDMNTRQGISPEVYETSNWPDLEKWTELQTITEEENH